MDPFQSKIQAALNPPPPFKKVLVGLSGGIDSMVLTHVLMNLGYEVVVAHLNHQLRKTANRDENFVVETAKKWNLICVTKKVVLPKSGNLENTARQIRYEFLEAQREAHQADFIAVGHHFDDQIETILMHEKRGAGLRGKRGMKLLSGKILRPLLDISRQEIERYAKAHEIDFMTDESNFDLSFERNRLRHEVIPKLKKIKGFEEKIKKKSKEADQKLNVLKTDRTIWIKKYVKDKSFDRAQFNKLKKDLKVEILIGLLGQRDLYQKNFDRLIDFIFKGKTGKELEVKGIKFILEYDRLSWNNIQSDMLPIKRLKKGVTIWGNYRIHVSEAKSMYVRSWKPGDRFQPAGMKGRKKLQDFFTDIKIPKYIRQEIAVVVNDKGDIICIGDLRFDEGYKDMAKGIKITKTPSVIPSPEGENLLN